MVEIADGKDAFTASLLLGKAIGALPKHGSQHDLVAAVVVEVVVLAVSLGVIARAAEVMLSPALITNNRSGLHYYLSRLMQQIRHGQQEKSSSLLHTC